MNISAILSGKAEDGTRYLSLFLKEYTELFSEKVNPSCHKCLNSYLEKYKNHFNMKKNESGYVLHAKYEGMPLEFGSQVFVNNNNITEEYAKKLLKQENGKRFFASMPEGKKEEKTPKNFEIELTQKDIDGNETLAAHKAGDKVVVNRKDYEADGTINLV